MHSLKRNALSMSSLLVLTFVTMLAAQLLVFMYVPTEETMGVVQRIFYFHVPLAWNSFIAFAVVFACSILYLRRRDMKWDRLARTSAEIGFLFTSLVLITGTIWSKTAWGTWWTWDPRLTTTLILWFIYLAYLLVSAYATEESRGARYAAVIGIIGFLDVPIVALAIILWRTQHPGPIIFEGGLTGSMLLTLMVCILAFTLLYFCLLVQGTLLRRDTNEIKMLNQSMDEGN